MSAWIELIILVIQVALKAWDEIKSGQAQAAAAKEAADKKNTLAKIAFDLAWQKMKDENRSSQTQDQNFQDRLDQEEKKKK